MVSMWLPCTFHVHTMWFPGGHYNVSNVDTICFPCENPMFLCEQNMVSILTSCGFNVDTM